MNAREQLKNTIREKVALRANEIPTSFSEDSTNYIFDFRRVLLTADHANTIAELFYTHFQNSYPFQLGSLEVAGIPLMTTIMNKLYEKGHHDSSAFFVRKSRKKHGVLNMVEGEIKDGVPIMLVDDIMNSGNSFWRQIEVLEELGHRVTDVWALIRFRDEDYYTRFHNRGIRIHSIFTLNDFTGVIGTNMRNLTAKDPEPPKMPFTALWKFSSENPSLEWVVSKSQPLLDKDRLYVGSDNRTLWALNQSDGSVAWKFQVGLRAQKKSIFSSPALFENLVIFGSYDGNVYALDSATGEKQWVFFDADWVGSSPAVAHDLGLVFIGLEFGLLRKRGGIAALDATTGKPLWRDYSHPALTHCSPHYIARHQQVVIGSNDGIVRLHDAKTGEKQWEFTTFGGASYDPKDLSGFGEGDIKEGFAYDAVRDLIIFGSVDGFLYFLSRATGHLVHHYKCLFGIWSTPYVFHDKVYFTSLDKHIRCIDLKTLQLVFEKDLDNTRIFSTPTCINGKLYVGTNAARLHELDPLTGEQLGYFQALERITNTPVYNAHTKMMYVPTYANEIIAITRTQ